MSNAQRIILYAAALPVEERLKIVDALLLTLNSPNAEIDKCWAEEATRRLDEWRSGKIEATPAENVFARIRERLGR